MTGLGTPRPGACLFTTGVMRRRIAREEFIVVAPFGCAPKPHDGPCLTGLGHDRFRCSHSPKPEQDQSRQEPRLVPDP